MPSWYEQILEANSARAPRRWQPFAKRVPTPYSHENIAWHALAYGYKTAADIVARECCESRRGALAEPLFFLFRHYIELKMKAVWKEFFLRGWVDCEPPENEHRLVPLWREIRTASMSIGLIDNNDELIINVDKSISLFNEIDSWSTHSRYPVVAGKCWSIDSDLESLICAVDDIETFFFGLSVMIEQADKC